jgi:hypothetical protein
MAFTASGSNPITYTGTDQADQGLFTTSNFIALGEGGDDLFNLGAVAQATVLGGQGNDLVTQNILTGAATSLQAGLVNGNLGNDTLGQLAYGMSGTISAFLGGQGNDTIYAGNLQSSQINGNLGNDTIFVGINGGALNTANSSIFGGQGDDVLSIADGGTARTYIATTFGGNLGNDSITISVTAAGTLLTNSTFEGGDGNDTISGAGSVQRLTLIGDGIENGFSGATGGADFLAGGEAGIGTQTGTTAASTLAFTGNLPAAGYSIGTGSFSVQTGGAGDSIFGGVLDDVLNGNNGQDSLSGGTGTNRFVFDREDLFTIVASRTALGAVSTSNAASIVDITSVTVTAGATDVITDWSAAAAGNRIQNALSNAFVANVTAGSTSIGSTITNGLGIQVVRGTWNASSNTFDFSANGADALALTTALSGTTTITSTTVLQGAGGFSFSQSNFI